MVLSNGTTPTAWELGELLTEAVRTGAVPGATAVLVTPDGTVHAACAGVENVDGGAPLSASTMFRYASMSKVLTTVGALQLIERGQLQFDQEVTSILPDFGRLQVLEGFDGERPRLRPPVRQATVGHLLNHTSGLGYFFCNPDVRRYHEAVGLPLGVGALNGAASLAAPLVADPGTVWEYGVSTDYLGLVIEAVSGLRLDTYLRTNVFEPLGMKDTTFRPSPEQRARLMRVHRRDAETGRIHTRDDILDADSGLDSGGSGAYGTALDYARFACALLRGGELDGSVILAPETVDRMFTDGLGQVRFPDGITSVDAALMEDATFPPSGGDFTLGLHVTRHATPGMRRAGSGGWDGIFNTQFWVDRAEGIAAVLMTQMLPSGDAGVLALQAEFERRVYKSAPAPAGTGTDFRSP
ncbi:serine hydrolase domain-containing protein [Streptomyces sp. NPDC051322]|uniref:serine hydrolase domain-containing protein n=1 Tax=Streptomyces sp. NPDC051322 TaxID=3154645 RepID=UPI00344CABC3